MDRIIRHGDVILKEVASIKGKPRKADKIVLAEGEKTGHFHVLRGAVTECVQSNGNRCIEVLEDAELTHEEHDSLTIPKGKYEVMIQREVDLLGETRQVMD